MNSHKDLKTLLADALELKDLDHTRLSELTDVPERYIWAIQNAEVEKLPPAPYIRGYIKKISETLHINYEEVWELYKKELEHKKSGAYDRLPINRFAIRHLTRNQWLLIALGVLLILYLIINMGGMRGAVSLIVTIPEAPIITVANSSILLTGKTEQRNKLTINGEEIFVSPDGSFSKEYALEPGINTIEFKAKKFLGREKIVTKQVLYQPLTGANE